MVIKVTGKVVFPARAWLSTHVVGPERGRYLVELRCWSGRRSWLGGLLTVPQEALEPEGGRDGGWPTPALRPGVYQLEMGVDRRGNRLVRFYQTGAEPTHIGFGIAGYVVLEACGPQDAIVTVISIEGYSRTKEHGTRWSFIAAPAGTVVAVEGYYGNPDYDYYRVTAEGLIPLGLTDTVLPPEEW